MGRWHMRVRALNIDDGEGGGLEDDDGEGGGLSRVNLVVCSKHGNLRPFNFLLYGSPVFFLNPKRARGHH